MPHFIDWFMFNCSVTFPDLSDAFDLIPSQVLNCDEAVNLIDDILQVSYRGWCDGSACTGNCRPDMALFFSFLNLPFYF